MVERSQRKFRKDKAMDRINKVIQESKEIWLSLHEIFPAEYLH